MPFAFTSASSLFIVSFGPRLLGSVVNPSTAIACAPHRHITAVNAKTLRLIELPSHAMILHPIWCDRRRCVRAEAKRAVSETQTRSCCCATGGGRRRLCWQADSIALYL